MSRSGPTRMGNYFGSSGAATGTSQWTSHLVVNASTMPTTPIHRTVRRWNIVWTPPLNCYGLTSNLRARHLNKYSVEFNRHLFNAAIPSTNNYAERFLRGAVLLRKVGCCNRSDRGVQTFETLSSLLATLRKRGLVCLSIILRQSLRDAVGT